MSDKEEASGYGPVNTSRLSGNLRGAALMVLASIGFTFYLLLNKLLSAEVNPVFLAFWRAFLGMWMALPFVAVLGFGAMKTRRPRLLILRSL